jgi:hypothetical protein
MCEPDQELFGRYTEWLKRGQLDPQHATAWDRLYNNDPEAAMCEAAFWDILVCHGAEITPNADLTGISRRPDFRCVIDGTLFYVEVKCIKIETATRVTKLPPLPDRNADPSALLNREILDACAKKTAQCANLDAPCLLAVGTFHTTASMICVEAFAMEWLLIGDRLVSFRFDPELAQGVGEPFDRTEFRGSVFTGWSELEGIVQKRQPISALLVAGLGCIPAQILGVLNPTPVRAFLPSLLSRIPFCRLSFDNSDRTVFVDWVQMPDDMHLSSRPECL